MARETIDQSEFRDLVLRHTVGLLTVLYRRWGSIVTEKLIALIRKWERERRN